MNQISTKFFLSGTLIAVGVLMLANLVLFLRPDNTSLSTFSELSRLNELHLERIPGYCKQLLYLDDEQALSALKEAISQLELHQDAMRQGGQVAVQQELRIVMAITDKKLAGKVMDFSNQFYLLKDKVQNLRVYVSGNKGRSAQAGGRSLLVTDQNMRESLVYIEQASKSLRQINGDIYLKINESIQNTKFRKITTSSLLVLLGIFLLGVNAYALRHRIFKPMHEAANKVAKIANLGKEKEEELAHFLVRSSNHLAEDIADATRFATDIRNGNLNTDLKNLTQSDKLGMALSKMRDQLRQINEEEEKRKWSNEGVADISSTLNIHNSSSQDTLAFAFLEHLIQHLEVNQGGVYLVENNEEDKPVLKLVSAFAFDRKKYLERTVPIEKGLIGQCLMEKATIYLEEVPNDYVSITSGLGKANPRSILLAPIKTAKETVGVVEVASFYKLAPYQISFVEDACARLGASLTAIRLNMGTQKLLEETQKVNETLQRKEDQMHENEVQLKKAQEQLNNKLKELQQETNLSKNIIEAINKTSATIEFDMDGTITAVNDMYLSIMGYTRDELMGRSEKLLVPAEEIDTQRYQLLWESLKEGSFISGEYKRITRQGKEVWLNGTYNPLFDISGKPFKIIKIAQFTTEEKERDLDFSGKINALNNAFPVIDLDTNGYILSGNPPFASLLGLKRKDFRKKGLIDFLLHPDTDAQKIVQALELVNRGEHQSIEVSIRVQDEKPERYCLINMNPIRNLQGDIIKIFTILVDLTENKALEKSLIEKKDLLSSMVSKLEKTQKELYAQKMELEFRIKMLNQLAMIFEISPERNITLANPAFCQALGLEHSEVVGRDFLDLLANSTNEAQKKEISNIFRREQIFRASIKYGREDRFFWGDTTIAPVLDEERKTKKYLGVVLDNTKQISKEVALQQSLLVEKTKNAMFQGESIQKNGAHVEQLLTRLMDEMEGNQNFDPSMIVQNDQLPTLLLSNTGDILSINQLGLKKLNNGKSLEATSLLDLLHFSEETEKNTFLTKIMEGYLLEQKVAFIINNKPVMLEILSLPIFGNNNNNYNLLVFLIA